MDSVSLTDGENMGYGFIPAEFLPEGVDEYYLRNRQQSRCVDSWRHLFEDEINALIQNHCRAGNWEDIFVTDGFDPQRVYGCTFYGMVRIGRLSDKTLKHHEIELPVGLYNSTVISSDIGDDVAVQNVGFLSHYIIGDRCILLNVDEMSTTNHAKFGNGILKNGEEERSRKTIEIVNEAGSRSVIGFDGMIAADAYLWARFRDDHKLQQRLSEMTQTQFDSHRGYYGTLGEQGVMKNVCMVKDVKFGSHCCISGANKLENLTVQSCENEPTRISEGAELVDGIVGYQCNISFGSKAERFVLGRNCNLKYGARLMHTIVGDNSTIACCEVLHNLIFPSHEQHHNNSFLIASLVKGQSNIAAGATIGSNHNSRSNDGEVQAGRGFWPGLCVSLKHSSRFASYTLLAKGSYPAELDVRLPFALLNNNEADDCLEVVPAYWWLYNMYALARNSWKFKNRDKRSVKMQHVEFESLAPDTIEEIFEAKRLIAIWVAKAALRVKSQTTEIDDEQLVAQGEAILRSGEVADLEIVAEGMEKSSRNVKVLKAAQGYQAYCEMLLYYAVKNLVEYVQKDATVSFASLNEAMNENRVSRWDNHGGQIVRGCDVDALRKDISNSSLDSWDAIHSRYDALWDEYEKEKCRHAYATLRDLLRMDQISNDKWTEALDAAVRVQELIAERVYQSRKKDFDNPFRKATCRNQEEMLAVLGTVDDDAFVKQVGDETEFFKKAVETVKARG